MICSGPVARSCFARSAALREAVFFSRAGWLDSSRAGRARVVMTRSHTKGLGHHFLHARHLDMVTSRTYLYMVYRESSSKEFGVEFDQSWKWTPSLSPRPRICIGERPVGRVFSSDRLFQAWHVRNRGNYITKDHIERVYSIILKACIKLSRGNSQFASLFRKVCFLHWSLESERLRKLIAWF